MWDRAYRPHASIAERREKARHQAGCDDALAPAAGGGAQTIKAEACQRQDAIEIQRQGEHTQRRVQRTRVVLEAWIGDGLSRADGELLRQAIQENRALTLREWIIRKSPAMNPVQKWHAVELAMELEDDLLAIHLATGEVAWKSTEEPNEIRRTCKQWRAARFSDARWMPPWPEGRPPLGVRWDGPFLSFSGYAWAARHYVEAAECTGLCVQARHLLVDEKYSATLTPSQHIAWKRRHHQPINPDIYLATSVPTTPSGINHYARLRKLNPGFSRNIGFTTFETDRLPPAWPEALRAMDEIWVPSEFNRRIFEEATGGNLPIRALPHAIDPTLYDNLPPHPAIPRDRFVFLATFELSPRKGWDLLLRAWTRAFSAQDRVLLHLHTFSRDGKNPEHTIQNELRKMTPHHPHAPVHVSHHPASDVEMRSLYASCQAFVLPSRGEGWGIPFMEAMCCGKSTIGPAEGGQADFMNSENAWLVPGQWESIPSRTVEESGLPAYYEGHRWFCGQEDALVDQLREVFRGGAEVERKAARGREEIRHRFSIPSVGGQLRRLIESSRPPAEAP